MYGADALNQAETLRGILHLRQKQNAIDGVPEAAFALRLGNMLLDQSDNFKPAGMYMADTVHDCFKFFDCNLYYTDRDMQMLLRVLQEDPPKERARFFEEIRGCRRRLQTPWQKTPIAKVFTLPDEYELLELRATIARFKELLKRRRMRVADAFRAFDYDRDGFLNCSEIYGGLEWLGLAMTPVEIYSLVRAIDSASEKDGRISMEEFEEALQVAEEDEEDYEVVHEQIRVAPKQITELYKKSEAEKKEDAAKKIEKIEKHELDDIKVKVTRVEAFRRVWDTRGTMNRKKMCVWLAKPPSAFAMRLNHERIYLGHYLRGSFKDPSSGWFSSSALKFYTIDLFDMSESRFSDSDILTPSRINFLFPHPSKYRKVWYQSRGGSKSIYVWRPVPPSNDFVAMGVVVTSSGTPPEVTAVRCVPKVRIWSCTFA